MRGAMGAVAAMLAGAALSAEAADGLPGDREAGLALARTVCAECHYVEPEWDGLSPWGAPSFDDIAQQPKWTPLSLRVFLRTPHQGLEMPDIVLTETEIDDVTAYIESLERD